MRLSHEIRKINNKQGQNSKLSNELLRNHSIEAIESLKFWEVLETMIVSKLMYFLLDFHLINNASFFDISMCKRRNNWKTGR